MVIVIVFIYHQWFIINRLIKIGIISVIVIVIIALLIDASHLAVMNVSEHIHSVESVIRWSALLLFHPSLDVSLFLHPSYFKTHRNS